MKKFKGKEEKIQIKPKQYKEREKSSLAHHTRFFNCLVISLLCTKMSRVVI